MVYSRWWRLPTRQVYLTSTVREIIVEYIYIQVDTDRDAQVGKRLILWGIVRNIVMYKDTEKHPNAKGNNPMVGATVAVAVSIEMAATEGKF